MTLQNEQGFTLIEALCAVVITSLAVLLAATLWQTSHALERQSALQTELARQAVAKLERLRAESGVAPCDTTSIQNIHHTRITEHLTIVPENGLYRVTLTYTWQERGRTREQTWAAYHL